ncbi:transmembrane protein 26-like isoform X3 [Pomacea canaliculata]|nr:transmembrane protein 26-like isoform X3 [Pomacea canaliculata]
MSVLPPIWIRSLYIEEHFLAYERAYKENSTCTFPYGLQNNKFFLYEQWFPVKAEQEATSFQSLIVTQQFMLGLLIVGRWMLPKGRMSSDELSQLLLIQVGIAADIADFYDALDDDDVRCDRKMALFMLGVWSYSLMQFTLVSTGGNYDDDDGLSLLRKFAERQKASERWICLHPVVYSNLVLILMQDVPFFVVRMMLIGRTVEYADTNVFFAFKNSMVIILGIYRLMVLNRDINEIRNRQLTFDDSYTLFNSFKNRNISLSTSYSSSSDDDEEKDDDEDGDDAPRRQEDLELGMLLTTVAPSTSNQLSDTFLRHKTSSLTDVEMQLQGAQVSAPGQAERHRRKGIMLPRKDSPQLYSGERKESASSTGKIDDRRKSKIDEDGRRKRSPPRVTWSDSSEIICFDSRGQAHRTSSPLESKISFMSAFGPERDTDNTIAKDG